MPDLERFGPKLIYQQIVDWMRNQISTGSWPEHYRLPSEFDLANDFGVSRGTIRKAINQLTTEGLLVTIHGRGTFVESTVIEQPLAEQLIAFSEALIDKKISYHTQVLRQEVEIPPQRIASLLSIPEGAQVMALERVRSVRQIPINYLLNYVILTRCSGIEKVDFSKQRLLQTFEERYKLTLGWGQRTFQAQSAEEDIANKLNISRGDPVMYMEQLIYLRDGSPIEFSRIWLPGNSFRLSAIVKRGDKRDASRDMMVFDPTTSG
ncbi:MAG: GntR family transcriptional regulator [Chloroflexi bacterium]|nr:GntR family transcriptional regulator [Chloroflexota bacterium]